MFHCVYMCVCVCIHVHACLLAQSCPPLCDPTGCGARQAPLSMGNNGLGCHALLQGIFPTQGSNPRLPHCNPGIESRSPTLQPRDWIQVSHMATQGLNPSLPHCRQILNCLNHQGSHTCKNIFTHMYYTYIHTYIYKYTHTSIFFILSSTDGH